MESSGAVPAQIMAESREQMLQLFSGLSAIAQRCGPQPQTTPNILQLLGAAPQLGVTTPATKDVNMQSPAGSAVSTEQTSGLGGA
eukprot:7969190-Karenia_brevis.AAC.2